jgi:hypothetical protein
VYVELYFCELLRSNSGYSSQECSVSLIYSETQLFMNLICGRPWLKGARGGGRYWVRCDAKSAGQLTAVARICFRMWIQYSKIQTPSPSAAHTSVPTCLKGKRSPRNMSFMAQRGVEIQLYSVSTSAQNGGGWLTPRPARFTCGKETRYSLYWRLWAPWPVWMGVKKRLLLPPASNPEPSSP